MLWPRSRLWHRFSRNPLSVVGFAIMSVIVLAALLAPWVTPYPLHAGAVVDISNSGKPPSLAHPFGTDTVGRDILTRTVFAYRLSLLLGIVVLSLATPVGVIVGLLAGYFAGWRETVFMRITDVFLSIPPLVLALAILGFLRPNMINAMIAVSAMWWPWYARLTYNVTRQVATEGYVAAAEVVGASAFHILFREILPNCAAPIVTKMTLDLGFVILLGSSLSFLGLGVQPPTPDLGSMVAEGARYLPDLWWLAVFPGLAILCAVLGFNLMGDGVRDLLDVER
ncbi:MAG: ABC transporter permease [Proteobacteria bacterium]|nr:ABC transporter permease [Pseudomonadota bacterium]